MLARASLTVLIAVAGTSWAAASPADSLLVLADAAHDRGDDRSAIEYYRQALRAYPRSYEALWKIARLCNDAGEGSRETSARRGHYHQAEQYARKAVAVNAYGAQGHMELGVALGNLAQDTVVQARMRVAREIRTQFEQAAALDSSLDYAWHALGRWHREMATLNWVEKGLADLFLGGVPNDASVKTSIACLARAVALRPACIDHRLQLGISYEAQGDLTAAAAEYRTVLSLPAAGAEDERQKKEARSRLRALEK
jgi:tetratricopeptide (TPR) repeat protein